jgi:methyl-accepting chemotaxis protein
MLRAPMVLAILLAGLLPIGCDTNSPESLCEARDDVQRSLDRVLDVNVIEQGTNALRSPLNQLRQDLTALADAAEEEFRDETTALRTALENVSNSIRDTEGMPLTDRASQFADALQQVVTAAEQLIGAVAAGCP